MRFAKKILRVEMNMKTLHNVIVGSALLLLSPHLCAYEVKTHIDISEAAYTVSTLGVVSSVLSDMGINSAQKFPNSVGTPGKILDLIQNGAEFEDNGSRPANHFYNPITGEGIHQGFIAFTPSPDWAIDGTGDSSSLKFSYKAARQYLFNALTDPSQTNRENQFGLMFQSLGQVIHHVQDMAQPQHTRLDKHCDLWFPCWLVGELSPSRYEKYTLAKTTLPLTGYAPVYDENDTATYNNARWFWHTADDKGMADYSNRGFVSAGTNFDNPDPVRYPQPQPNPALKEARTVSDWCGDAGEDMNCAPDFIANFGAATMTFYGSTVEDRYRPALTATNRRTSTESIFDQDLMDAGQGPVFSLNRFNFDAAHKLLIPRAVGYSAGLINYFFRGKLDFVPNPTDGSKYLIKNLGTENMNGTFGIYYDGIDGKRHLATRSDGTALKWASVSLSAGDAFSIPMFSPPTNPASSAPGTYTLVFNGDMGQETSGPDIIGAVAVKHSQCEKNTQTTDYPPVTFTGDSSYESLPAAWLTRDADGKLFLNALIWIKKNPIPPPIYKCFPGPLGCIWYLYYPASPYANGYDPAGDRYDPALQSSNEFVKIWIDLNGDKIFSDDELVLEKQYSPYLVASTWYTNQLIALHEPLTMPLKEACQTSMRIAMRWGKAPIGPNDNFEFGSLGTVPVQLR